MREEILRVAGEIQKAFQNNQHIETTHTNHGYEKTGFGAGAWRFLRGEPRKFYAETFVHLKIPGTKDHEHIHELDRQAAMLAAILDREQKNRGRKISVTTMRLVEGAKIVGFKFTIKN